jgi:hypothetical protein
MSVVALDAVRRQRAAQAERAAAPARPHLTLVPTGRDAVRAARSAQPPLRLTALGRLVVALLVAAVVTVLAIGLAGQLASASGQPRTITVEWGQTLSGIAARELPDLPISEGVVELQIANALSTSQIHAGQHLVIPAR